LAAKDAASKLPDLEVVDQVIKTTAEQLGRSNVRREKFLNLQYAIRKTDLQVDLTTVAATVDDACSALKQRYVTPVGRFGEFKQSRLAPFLKKHASTEKRVLVIEGVDAEGNTVMDTVPLHDEPIGKGALYGTSPEECYDLAKVFAQGLIDALDSRLDDLKMVDGANLFRPKKYPLLHTGKREKYWSDNLDLLFKLFDYKLPGVGKDACDADIGMLTNTLLKRHEN
ncbi:hypothetical protein CLOM_g9484, partial [Closterium sp. NIES-68]